MIVIDGIKRDLFRRCVQCPDTSPSCPQCKADEICSLISATCDMCPQTQCTKIGAPLPPPTKQSSPAGPIAGGVIGGIAVISILTYLVWRFCIKKRREQFDQNDWSEGGTEKDGNHFSMQRDARASTHTVGSTASTVLTRASNVIQIAYIPGVTNRSIESSPDHLVPPVPPIPAISPSNSTVTSPQPGQDQHFFMPSDLRDSRYSGYTDDGRSSFARSSMAPSMTRSSIATTSYQHNAVLNPVPAQTATRAQAVAVSVRSSGKNSPIDTPRSVTPPVPSINYQKHGPLQHPVVARLGVPRAVTVTKSASKNGLKSNTSAVPNPSEIPMPTSPSNSETSQPPLANLERSASIADPNRHNGDSSTFDDASSDEDVESPAEQSLMGHNRQSVASLGWGTSAGGFRSPSSAPDLRHSPFKAASTSSFDSGNRLGVVDARNARHTRSGSLNQIIEEATRRASREPRHGGLGSLGGSGAVGSLASWKKEGPFSDANAARTP